MSLADLERSLLSRLEASGELSKIRSSTREAALRELDGLSSSLASRSTRPAKPPPPRPTPPAETVVALELVREFLDYHGFRKARSLLEAEADLPPCRGRRGGGSFFGRRALASLVGVEEEERGEDKDESHPPPLLYSVMAKAAAAAAGASSKRTRSGEER